MARPRRPVRNPAARSWCAEVRRFLRLINADEVLGTHTRPRERIWELAAFQGAEVGYRMLQIQRVFSRQNRHREPFARGWWRRERNWKLTFSRQASVFQRTQASRVRFSACTPDWLARKCRWPPALLVFPADREPCKIVAAGTPE